VVLAGAGSVAVGGDTGPPREGIKLKWYGGRNTPRSVMMALNSAAGVTSKAGLNTGDAVGAVWRPATPRTSAASRSSITMVSPLGIDGSMVEDGAAT
jgi:hypothetical protein